MEREEAIQVLNDAAWIGTWDTDREKIQEAVDMAIEALSEEKLYTHEEAWGMCDRISRADAIACLSHGDGCGNSCRKRINALPSARPTGEWEHLSIKSISRSGVDGLQALQCSNCGKWVTTPYMYYPSYHKFCPCCGAKMINSNNGLDMRGGDTE